MTITTDYHRLLGFVGIQNKDVYVDAITQETSVSVLAGEAAFTRRLVHNTFVDVCTGLIRNLSVAFLTVASIAANNVCACLIDTTWYG